MVVDIDLLQQDILAYWKNLCRSASHILCWWFIFILCDIVVLWELRCWWSIVFSGLWILEKKRWYRCRTILHPWRMIRSPWNWCIPINPWICSSSGYVTSRRGYLCHSCENVRQLLQSLHLAITLWKIYAEIFSRYLIEFTTAYDVVTMVWVRYLCLKNCVTNPFRLHFLGTNFECPEMLYGSTHVTAVDDMYAPLRVLSWILMQ